jgi:hypothetical protein
MKRVCSLHGDTMHVCSHCHVLLVFHAILYCRAVYVAITRHIAWLVADDHCNILNVLSFVTTLALLQFILSCFSDISLML